jgi:hypothetical protein
MKKLLVLLAAGAFVLGLTLPAMSADWSFYGSIRMHTFVESDSEEVTETDYDDDDLLWDLQGNSRIGASVKAGNIGGGFEYGSGPSLRLLYGTWNFGAGSLLVGQHYTPVNAFPSNRVGIAGGDEDMLNFGGIYAGRDPMIQISAKGFKFALIKPNATAGVVDKSEYTEGCKLDTETCEAERTQIPTKVGTDVDTDIPRLEMSYSFKAGPLSLTPIFGYNTYDEVDPRNNKEYGIDSYIAALVFGVDLGPAYIKGDVYKGQNLRQYGFGWMGAVDDSAYYDDGNDKIVDNDNMGYLAVFGFKFSDALSFEAGYGYAEGERDEADSKADEVSSYYAQATINVAKGFSITPEIGKIDYKKGADGKDQGDTTYFGAKWQVNF